MLSGNLYQLVCFFTIWTQSTANIKSNYCTTKELSIKGILPNDKKTIKLHFEF